MLSLFKQFCPITNTIPKFEGIVVCSPFDRFYTSRVLCSFNYINVAKVIHYVEGKWILRSLAFMHFWYKYCYHLCVSNAGNGSNCCTRTLRIFLLNLYTGVFDMILQLKGTSYFFIYRYMLYGCFLREVGNVHFNLTIVKPWQIFKLPA